MHSSLRALWLLPVLLASSPAFASAPNLVDAARAGDAAQVEALLKGGADPDGRKGVKVYPIPVFTFIDRGSTPLCAAVESGHPEIVRTLLEHGADRTKRCGGQFIWFLFMEGWLKGKTPLGIAVDADDGPKKPYLIQALLEDPKQQTLQLTDLTINRWFGLVPIFVVPVEHYAFDPDDFTKMPAAKLPVYRALGRDTAPLEAAMAAQQKVDALEQKADAGDAEAAYQVCLRYEAGDGVDKDLDKAKTYCRKADDAGHPKARSVFERILKESESDKEVEAVQAAQQAQAANAAASGSGLGVLSAVSGMVPVPVPGGSALGNVTSHASDLRGGVQTGIDAAQSAKAASDAAARAEGLKIRVPAAFKNRKVAVLPVNNMTPDLQGPLLYRQLMQMQLGAAGFRAEGTDFLDDRLKELGVTDGGQLGSVKTDALGTALESDALLYGELLVFKNQNLGVYATRTVEAHAWLVDAKSGKTLWDSTQKRSNPKVSVSDDAIRSNTISGYAGSIMEKAMASPLRPETEDVVRMLVKDMASTLDQR